MTTLDVGIAALRTAAGRLLTPLQSDGFLEQPCARLDLLRALDSEHVLPLAAVGQAVVGGAGDRIGVQGAGEIRGLDHSTGRRIDFHLDVDAVAGYDTGGFSVGVAEAEQVAATHDGHPALP